MKIDVGVAVEALAAGRVVGVPTQTLYGLAARADDARAVERVFELKGRRPALPSPCLVADAAAVRTLLKGPLEPRVLRLVDRFGPGALTVVVGGARDDLAPGLVGAGGTVGVRQDGDPTLARVLRGLGVPVTGTSANRSGEPACRWGREVDALFEGRLDYAGRLGDGPTMGGMASTVVRADGASLVLLRDGALDWPQISSAWEALRDVDDD